MQAVRRPRLTINIIQFLRRNGITNGVNLLLVGISATILLNVLIQFI